MIRQLTLILMSLATVASGLSARLLAQPLTTAPPHPALCRESEPLTLFVLAVRQVLRAHDLAGDWPVYQLPCDSLPEIADNATRAILVVDRAAVTDQAVLQYGFAPFPFATAAAVEPRPNDPFARLGRLLAPPPLSAPPSIWLRGALPPAAVEPLRLALAAGAVQTVAGFTNPLCSPNEARVVHALLGAAVDQARNHPDYLLYLQAAQLEQQAVNSPSRPPAPLASLNLAAEAVAADLSTVTVPGLRCDIGNRERFSLSPSDGTTSLTRAAAHITSALTDLRRRDRADLGQLNLARVCVLDAVRDLLRRHRTPSCRTDDYGLWNATYAPLLHAAEVKMLGVGR